MQYPRKSAVSKEQVVKYSTKGTVDNAIWKYSNPPIVAIHSKLESMPPIPLQECDTNWLATSITSWIEISIMLINKYGELLKSKSKEVELSVINCVRS